MIISFRKAMMLLIGISLLVTVAVGGIGGYFMLKNADSATYQYENIVVPAFYIEEMKANFWKAHGLLLQAALDKDPALIEANFAKVPALYRQNDDLLRQYALTESSGSAEDALYAQLVEKRRRFHELNARALELVRLTTDDQAIDAFNRYNNEVILPVMRDFTDALDALSTHLLQVSAQTNIRNERASDTAVLTIAGIIATAVVLLLAAGFYFASGIIRAVGKETAFASAIAEGNLEAPLDPDLPARKDEFGAMGRALSTMRDSLKRLIGDLSVSNEAAQKASQHKSIFLSRMSHEIRTPLNAIIGMTYIAKKAREREVVNDSLNKISTSSTHLLGLINDILDMSKIEAGRFELVEEDFSLEKLLMSVCTVASAKVDEKEQNLVVNLASGLGSRYVGDGLRLSQVLTNILGNACKFTPARGTIRLTAACAEKNSLTSHVRFTVEDTGIGMTDEQMGRLFKPFEQADGGTFRQFGGTGLGLSICDKIVTLMGGDIRVESEFGKGSKFIITVKLKNSERYEPARLDAAIDARRTKIMVVDRAEEVRSFFDGLFRRLDIVPATAAAVEPALELLRENSESDPFSIVFLDWDTTGEEGGDFVKKVKAEFGGRVVVILVSSTRFAEVEDKAAEAGADRFLPKPLFPSAVINLVNEVIGVPAKETPKAAPGEAPFAGRRLLLVEDNEINREIACAYLEDTGITVEVAENGVEAVEKYLGEPAYDLIFMDVHMPVMDGYTASRRIRAEEGALGRGRVPIVALTANAFKEDIACCLEAGMDDHIAKPMCVDAVGEMLNKYLAA